MRYALAIFLQLALTPLAGAADWVRIDIPHTDDEYFFDRSKLVVNGNSVTYWKKVRFMPPRPMKKSLASAALMRERIDCREHTLRLLSFLYQDAQGAMIEYVADAEKEGAPIIPDTVGDQFEQILCTFANDSTTPLAPETFKIEPHAL